MKLCQHNLSSACKSFNIIIQLLGNVGVFASHAHDNDKTFCIQNNDYVAYIQYSFWFLVYIYTSPVCIYLDENDVKTACMFAVIALSVDVLCFFVTAIWAIVVGENIKGMSSTF